MKYTQDDVERIAEPLGLWPKFDGQNEMFVDGAEVKEELTNFANAIAADKQATIEKLFGLVETHRTLIESLQRRLAAQDEKLADAEAKLVSTAIRAEKESDV